MKRFVLAGAGALAMFASVMSANAADLPRRTAMPMKAPAYAPYNWTGFYVGINGGGAWGRSEWNSPLATTGDFKTSGELVGGTLGYNWQAGPSVFGIETDLDWTNIHGSTATACAPNCETKNDWLGTTRGRIGYAFDRFMPFVTGGVAYGDVKPGFVGFGHDSDTRVGWTVGAGLEAAIAGPWSLKAEYLYADLGKANCSVGNCGAAGTEVKFNTNIVRGGINYRF